MGYETGLWGEFKVGREGPAGDNQAEQGRANQEKGHEGGPESGLSGWLHGLGYFGPPGPFPACPSRNGRLGFRPGPQGFGNRRCGPSATMVSIDAGWRARGDRCLGDGH